MTMDKTSFFCSWSGGKDSCLALYRAIKKGWHPSILLTMMIENGERSRSHGLPISLLKEQAQSLSIPMEVCAASWQSYEEQFVRTISGFKRTGVEAGVFGDIDLDDHKKWVEKVCASASIKPWHPLWKEERRHLLEEFINLGFKATIISIKESVLDKKFLGNSLDKDIVAEIEGLGIDACGEEGEFHTVVTDGPIFSFPIHLEAEGQVLHDGYWFQDVSLV